MVRALGTGWFECMDQPVFLLLHISGHELVKKMCVIATAIAMPRPPCVHTPIDNP